MKKDYLIAVDLDGTLITGFDNYDKMSFSLLKELAKTNKVVIATGRPFRSSKYYYDILELNTPIINYNGALVFNPNDKLFPKSMITIEREMLFDFINSNKEELINVFCEIEDDIFLWKNDDFVTPYLHLDGGILHTGSLDKILYGDSNGAIVFSKKGSEEKLKNFISEKYNDHLKIRFWFNNECVVSEIYNPLATKGLGLKKIVDYYNIDNKKIIAIGDGHNDIEMLEMANYKVAMEVAHPDLLRIANHITKDVSNNGVYHYLKDFFKI